MGLFNDDELEARCLRINKERNSLLVEVAQLKQELRNSIETKVEIEKNIRLQLELDFERRLVTIERGHYADLQEERKAHTLLAYEKVDEFAMAVKGIAVESRELIERQDAQHKESLTDLHSLLIERLPNYNIEVSREIKGTK